MVQYCVHTFYWFLTCQRQQQRRQGVHQHFLEAHLQVERLHFPGRLRPIHAAAPPSVKFRDSRAALFRTLFSSPQGVGTATLNGD